MHEYFLFGRARVDTPKYPTLVAKHWDGKSWADVGKERIEYLNYEAAKSIAKDPDVQPGDPTDPPKKPMNILRLEIIDALLDVVDLGKKRGSVQKVNSVRMYTMTGTHFDKLHGVDALLEVQDTKTGVTYSVTFDATLNRPKLTGDISKKADILIGELPDAIEESKAFYEQLAPIVAEVKERILSQQRAAAGQRPRS